MLGTNYPVIEADAEAPLRTVELPAYQLGMTTVTVREYSAFVAATGYITQAERNGYSHVFAHSIADHADDLGPMADMPWWHVVRGATWKNPFGCPTGVSGHPDLPVVHLSWEDCHHFAKSVGGRLPSEVEWEHAARGGLGDVRYPWGDDEPPEGGGDLCNIWSGQFPEYSTPLCPSLKVATSSLANGYGLRNMSGNVWEWTADIFSNAMGQDTKKRLLKGGSYLCHHSYCWRYRIAARMGVSIGATTDHIGFRVVFDA